MPLNSTLDPILKIPCDIDYIFIHLFIHKYFLSTYYIQGPRCGSKNM